jgi:hypothetical protein
VGIRSSHRQSRRNVAAEINASLLPPALHGSLGQVLEGTYLGERKSAEKFQIHYFSQLRLKFRQPIQSIAD